MTVADPVSSRIERSLPVLAGARDEILPVLAAVWLLAGSLFIVFRWPAWLVFAVWGSVTIVMLWPVGRAFGLPYLTYRHPLFIAGVLSMASLPILGLVLDSGTPISADDLGVRLAALLATVAVLTIFSVVPAARWAIGPPMPMFFRPDILFGDGRILATGIISLGLSFRFIVGGLPLEDPHLPALAGSWWGLLFAIVFGLIQIIPGRGIMKIRMRLARAAQGTWKGWGSVILREAYLVVATLAVLYGFHNVYGGKVPLVDQTLQGLQPEHFEQAGLPALVSLALAAAYLIVVRGAYKRHIGDPFIRQTRRQSAVKQLLLVIGVVWLMYSAAIIMVGRPFLGALNTEAAPLLVGGALFAWGIVLLGPIRFWAQRNQRLALIGQMSSVVLPAMPHEQRHGGAPRGVPVGAALGDPAAPDGGDGRSIIPETGVMTAIAGARRSIRDDAEAFIGSHRRLLAAVLLVGALVVYVAEPRASGDMLMTFVIGLGLPTLIVIATSVGVRGRQAQLEVLIKGSTATPAPGCPADCAFCSLDRARTRVADAVIPARGIRSDAAWTRRSKRAARRSRLGRLRAHGRSATGRNRGEGIAGSVGRRRSAARTPRSARPMAATRATGAGG